MCIAVPGKIIDIFPTLAKVTMLGVETLVNIQMIEEPKLDDYVLVHAGCAIQKIDKENYDDLYALFKSLVDADER